MEKGTPTPSTCFLVSKILPHQQLIFQGVAKVILQLFLFGGGGDPCESFFQFGCYAGGALHLRYAEEW